MELKGVHGFRGGGKARTERLGRRQGSRLGCRGVSGERQMPIVLAYAEPPSAVAPAAAPMGPIIDPQWENLQVYPGEIERYYPPAALAQGVRGVVVIECTVSGKGRLEDCKALREDPEGMQFGPAAVKLATRFRMKTTTRSGVSAVGRIVRMPIEFNFAWAMFEPINPRPTFDVLVSPKWAKRPTGEDLARYYPKEAMRTSTEGEVILQCQVRPDGQLSPCSVTKEQPEKYDFGDTALKLATKLQVDMQHGPGLSAAGKLINIPVKFAFPR
jgi:TonB family protein